MERQESIERWLLGIPCEVSFWKNALARKTDREWIAGNAGRDIDLHNFDVKEFMGEPGNSPDDLIIDLGCGLSYYAGSRLGGRPANIHFVDPLADFYNDILKEARTDLPPIEFGMMEHISSYPHQQEVALVIIQNALDHSQDPIKGIVESLNLLKMGGVLYLKHYPNEAEKEAYRGFHQWNIDIEDGRMVVWNRDERHDLNGILEDFTEMTTSRHGDPDEVIAVIRKTGEVPESLLDLREDVWQLGRQLLIQARLASSLPFAVRYHAKRALYFLARRTANLAGPAVKERVRRLYRRMKRR